jgi:hypothetical protein
MAKEAESKAVEKLVESIADIRFKDSSFAANVLKQPPNIQRRIMKLFLTLVRFWGVDHKYIYNIHKDEDVAELAWHIDKNSMGTNSLGEQILDGKQSPMIEYYNNYYEEQEAIKLDELDTK